MFEINTYIVGVCMLLHLQQVDMNDMIL